MKRKIFEWLHKKYGIHYWRYRNPADRKCVFCDKHQQEYFMWYEGENPFTTPGWWEDVS